MNNNKKIKNKITAKKIVSKKWWAKDHTVSRNSLFKRKVKRNDEIEDEKVMKWKAEVKKIFRKFFYMGIGSGKHK